MNHRTNLLAAAALALGVFACDRNTDRASETRTTSAPQPADNSGAATPAAPADTRMNINVEAKDGGRAPSTLAPSTLGLDAKDGGHRATGTQTGPDGPDHARAPLDHNDIGAGGSPTR